MFNNQQNNQRENNNVNTRGLQFMNKNGFDPSTIAIGYWNEMVSIKIHPALEKSKQTDNKVFDYEKVVSTALTVEKCRLLARKIRELIIPAIKEGVNASTGVPVGGNSLIVVGTGKKITGSIRPYVAIHKSLDESTKKPEMSIYYEFNQAYTIDDYDVETGSFVKNDDVTSELDVFLAVLDDAVSSLSNGVSHSVRTVDRFFRDRIQADMAEIGSKLGVTIGSNRRYGNKGGYSRNDVFASGGSSAPSNNESQDSMEMMSTETISNMDAINDYLS